MSSRFVCSILLIALAAGLAWLPAQERVNPPSADPSAPAHLAAIGWTRLVERMKKDKKELPTGAGVWVAQVEPSVSGDAKKPQLQPDKSAVYEKPRADVTINVPSQKDGPPSGHSTSVAQHFYGRYSVAQGITRIDVLDPGSEFIPKWLGLPKGTMMMATELPKISSHSYVEGSSNPTVVRRLDEFIVVNDHIAVVAVGVNEEKADVAPLFGTSYNALVIGLSNGKCAHGTVKEADDGAGRIRPDLVLPTSVTSTATPLAAGAVAVLVEAAGRDTLATKPIVIKACLMAGAEKNFPCEFIPSGWANTDNRPLNPFVGAGQLDVDIAHLILTSGRTKHGEKIDGGLSGWAIETIAEEKTVHVHTIDVPDEYEATSVSASLVWNRTFAGGKPIMPNLNLSFGRVDADNEFEKHFEKSISETDNVELIWHTANLPPGRYGFKVTDVSGEKVDYALAWHVTTKPHPKLRRDPPKGKSPPQSAILSRNTAILIGLVAVGLVFVFVFRRRLMLG